MTELNIIQAVLYTVSIISVLFFTIVQIGKYFCVQPFYDFSRSKFYSSDYTWVIGFILLLLFVSTTIGMCFNNVDMINFGIFVLSFGFAITALVLIILNVIKLCSFISDYHQKLVHKRFGDDNE